MATNILSSLFNKSPTMAPGQSATFTPDPTVGGAWTHTRADTPLFKALPSAAASGSPAAGGAASNPLFQGWKTALDSWRQSRPQTSPTSQPSSAPRPDWESMMSQWRETRPEWSGMVDQWRQSRQQPAPAPQPPQPSAPRPDWGNMMNQWQQKKTTWRDMLADRLSRD
jgi:hypothetical protein